MSVSVFLQGKVHLELRLSEVITDSGAINHKLATRWDHIHTTVVHTSDSYSQQPQILIVTEYSLTDVNQDIDQPDAECLNLKVCL